MMVSTKGRYALNVMMDLANSETQEFVSLSEIAERQRLSMKYLEIVVAILNKGGLVNSLRGKKGGYKLSRRPSEYTINEILTLTEGSLAPVECVKQDHAHCEKADKCATLPLWQGLDRVIDGYLSNITLQDVIDGNWEKINAEE